MSIGNGTVSIAVDREGNLVVCVKNDRLSGSKGLWMGDNPFDFMLPITIFQMALCLLVSRLVYFLLRPIGTHKFICSVLGGILLGPSGLGRIETFKLTLFPPR
ncbi:hypothetical protein L6164_030129 [Bauhinia variegata]|uniref:Uncharacterized protein n=1 Tax=Bauhinia variegata TaxID=167791 RepID=A0ACB9LAY3_BAUVA|nr:hypothetical protein L6164_030129 [Bauhinia variegata]